jgi:hypothetical protein
VTVEWVCFPALVSASVWVSERPGEQRLDGPAWATESGLVLSKAASTPAEIHPASGWVLVLAADSGVALAEASASEWRLAAALLKAALHPELHLAVAWARVLVSVSVAVSA